jgi:predicted small metal-binding protein
MLAALIRAMPNSKTLRAGPPAADVSKMIIKSLHCDHLMNSCDFVARGASEDEVMDALADHMRTVHGLDRIAPEMTRRVREEIHGEQCA